jgi:LPS-assembly protein
MPNMRFRSKPVVFLLLLSFTPPVLADEHAFVLKPTRSLLDLPEPTQATPLFMYADQIKGVKDSQFEATGHVEMRRLGQRVWADYLLYLQQSQELHATGSVRFDQNRNTLLGPELHLNLKTGTGDMPHPRYNLGETNAHGQAESLHIASRENYTLSNATYTTCSTDNEDWMLKAGTLNINQGTQIGEARDVTISWLGVPFLYSPWMDFPLNSQRKSGFLGPVFGATTKGGSELTVPYYWNIAPNMDATLAPRVMQKRGVLLNNEFRYLQPSYTGEVRLNVLPSDMLTKTSRTYFGLKHQQTLPANLLGAINYNYVSDDSYFRDLSDSINSASQINLLREGVLAYNDGGWWNAQMRVQRFQTLQDPAALVVVPYHRTPQISLNALHPIATGTFKFNSEFVDFSHPTAVNGQRVVLYPSISYPLISSPGVFVTPKLGFHSTTYSMGANNAAQLPANQTRSLPIISLDSGLFFDQETSLWSPNYIQTLEPRAYFVHIPYRDQSRLPVFDTAQAGFNFDQIFSENRFIGSDRVGDANQVTTALTSRLLDRESGEERMRFILGQRFSSISPKVNLTIPTGTTNKSDILLGFSARASRTWSMDSLLQYNPSLARNELFNASARYQPEPGKVLNFGYRFMRNTLNIPNNFIDHINVSAQWPLYGRWGSVVRTNFSLHENRLVEGLAGLEYNQDCWTIRMVAQRFAVSTAQASTGFFLQLELNGLVKVGPDPLQTLRQSIPGYTKTNQPPNSASLPNLYD